MSWLFLILDDEVVKREEEAIKLDGLNVAQIKELRDKAEKFAFQAEVNRMMKLIINSLYRNKEVSWEMWFLECSVLVVQCMLSSITNSCNGVMWIDNSLHASQMVNLYSA